MRWVVFAGALAACAEPGSDLASECNPLGGDSCLAPWPSMAYVRRDSELSTTGFRLALPSEAMPHNREGTYIHPAPYNRWDGFSTLGPMFATFATSIAADALPPDPEASLAPDAAVVLVDTSTGEHVAIDVELADDAHTIVVRPVRRLHPAHRYAVAIRDRVRASDGSALPVTEGFAALRDGAAYDHPRFAMLRDGATAMFSALGIPRHELVLAWDFVTASDDFVHSDLVAMRNQALPVIGPDGEYLAYTLTPTAPGRYTGVVRAPNFLAPNGLVLHRDEWEWNALPMLDGTHDARFAVFVPACASTPRPAILVGNALFGSLASPLDDPFVQRLANARCAIVIATEQVGLDADHRDAALAAMTQLGQLPIITENLAQSTIDLVSIAALVRGPLSRELPIDRESVTFVGDSLGGMIGATYLAYEMEPMRAAISPMTWPPSELVAPMQAEYPPATHAFDLALIGMAFEPYDPRVTAAAIAHDTLVWSAMGDGTEAIAREMALPVLAPSVMSPWGMSLASDAPSGLVIFDGATATPALARQITQVIDRAPLTMQCALAGAPAPCDCATGACD